MNFRFIANNVQVLSVDENSSADGSIKWNTITIFDAVAKKMCTLTCDRLVAVNTSTGDVVNLLVECSESAKLSSNGRAAFIDNKFKAVNVAPCSEPIKFSRLYDEARG